MQLALSRVPPALVLVVLRALVCSVVYVHCLAIDKQAASQQQAIEHDDATEIVKRWGTQQQPQWVPTDQRRPIWVIAHMVNSIKELDYRLGKGANAVEVDVTFSQTGEPLYMYHGPPCDCWRHCHQHESFNDYLSYVREISVDEPGSLGQNLSLLFLDLKLDPLNQPAKANAGSQLASSLLTHLFTGDAAPTSASNKSIYANDTTEQNQPQLTNGSSKAPLHLVVSINHVNDIDLVLNFVHYFDTHNASHLLRRIGFDVGMNDDIQSIESMWRRFSGTKLNLWQGDGYTNCLSPFYNLQRLSRALVKRDDPQAYPAKVYHWTIDLHARIRESLLMGVDAIMTNHPERILAVLREPDIAHGQRLAAKFDDPFIKLTRQQVGKISETARYQRSAYSASGGFFSSLMDVVASWLDYLREIPFLSFPTTTKIFARTSRTPNGLERMRIRQQQQADVQLRKGPANSASAESSVVNRVDHSNQPEYQLVDTATSKQNNGSGSNSTSVDNTTLPPTSVSGQTIVQQPPQTGTSSPGETYEAPKWYTILASEFLAKLLKNILS